jgi:hypothetical protein
MAANTCMLSLLPAAEDQNCESSSLQPSSRRHIYCTHRHGPAYGAMLHQALPLCSISLAYLLQLDIYQALQMLHVALQAAAADSVSRCSL